MGRKIKEWVTSDCFWDSVRLILKITKLIFQIIKLCDKDGAVIGEVYEGLEDMLGKIKDNLKDVEEESLFLDIQRIVNARRKKMNVPLHSLAYALTPHYYDSKYIASPAPGGRKRSRPIDDVAVVEGVMKTLETIAQDDDLFTILRGQFAKFSSQSALFSMQAAKVDAFLMPAIEWWSMYGAQTTQLAEVARRVLSQPVSTSSAERNWSTYSFIHNIKRNRLNSVRADKLVFIHSNLRMLSRFNESYHEGPFKKWDIDRDEGLFDDSSAKLEELRWASLDE
ncbi:hypothetical protein HHK36_030445 [Tetracentron sinense]|uniref:HAT C-terminal dimerisation domain-containing protein n=1 Tax=Tetracentron sinense TaxID=13715 RepID=A0A834YBQ1_TETSI|nr:hypothetical protein HHK36_030445 [Tetracentron sinense]